MTPKKKKIVGGIAAIVTSFGMLAATTGTAHAAPAVPAAASAQVSATAQAAGATAPTAVSAKTTTTAKPAPTNTVNSSTQTLDRKGKKTATITPATKGVPAGAKVTSNKVTVKKGKKTVAKNKSSYKAKKGTYKVTTTTKYQPKVKKNVALDPNDYAECQIKTRKITKDNVTVDGQFLTGNATIYSTATCQAEKYNEKTNKYETYTWNTSWTVVAPVFTTWDSYEETKEEAIFNQDNIYEAGDTGWVRIGNLDSLPTYTTYGPTKTATSTRTVIVK